MLSLRRRCFARGPSNTICPAERALTTFRLDPAKALWSATKTKRGRKGFAEDSWTMSRGRRGGAYTQRLSPGKTALLCLCKLNLAAAAPCCRQKIEAEQQLALCRPEQNPIITIKALFKFILLMTKKTALGFLV